MLFWQVVCCKCSRSLSLSVAQGCVGDVPGPRRALAIAEPRTSPQMEEGHQNVVEAAWQPSCGKRPGGSAPPGCDGGRLGTSALALRWFSDTRCWLSSVPSGSCLRKPAEAGLKASGSTSLAQQATKLRASSMPKVYGDSSGSRARLLMR